MSEIDKNIKIEKAKARKLRQTVWWQNKIQDAFCYYCETAIAKELVTMDHVVPLSQGGLSSKSNIVICCKKCNTEKSSMTAVEWQLKQLNKT